MEEPGLDAALDGARGGDDESFAVLFRALQPPLLRYLRVVAGSYAEDLASETWGRVARDLVRFDGDADRFRRWLFTIARHRALDWRRARGRSPAGRPLDGLGDPAAADDPAAETVELLSADAARRLVARLPRDEAEVVVLLAVSGLDPATVGRIVGRRPGAVTQLGRRGLRRLAALLDDDRAPATGSGAVTP